MKTLTLRTLIPLLTAVAFTASAAPKKAAKSYTLDDLLRWPGDYSQICDATTMPFPAAIPAFRSIMHGEAGFSTEKMKYIKANRATILTGVAAKLGKVDLLRKPVAQKPDPSLKKDEVDIDPIGVDPDSFNSLLLVLIEDLDGVEALPQLLALEDKYHTLLLAAEKDPKAPLPQTDGDGAGVGPGNLWKEGEDPEKATPERQAEVDRGYELFGAQAVHRDMLAICVKLMRKSGYEPMLQSDIEKTYGKLLKEKWAGDEELSKIKSNDDIPKEEREDQYRSLFFDPVHKVAYRTYPPIEFPYSEQVRTQILTLTKSFIESKKKGAEKPRT
jgi:hypothetical protein